MQDRFDLKHDSDITATQLEQVLGNASCRRVWELGLSALRDGDQKWSSCEKTLARFAVRAGWPDQGIAILLTAFRRRHGLDLKLRENHYATVISVARKAVVVEGAQADLDQALFDTPENQAEVLKSSLAILFGVDITHMIKYLGDPSVYYMMTKQGNVTIGGIDRIYSQTPVPGGRRRCHRRRPAEGVRQSLGPARPGHPVGLRGCRRGRRQPSQTCHEAPGRGLSAGVSALRGGG